MAPDFFKHWLSTGVNVWCFNGEVKLILLIESLLIIHYLNKQPQNILKTKQIKLKQAKDLGVKPYLW